MIIEDFWTDDFNFCMCGDPEATQEWLTSVLLALEKRSATQYQVDTVRKAILADDEAVKYFVLYVLDAMGLTEHGSSVDGCWLTGKGKDTLRALQEQQGAIEITLHPDTTGIEPLPIEIRAEINGRGDYTFTIEEKKEPQK